MGQKQRKRQQYEAHDVGFAMGKRPYHPGYANPQVPQRTNPQLFMST
jgi:hypothetical protein